MKSNSPGLRVSQSLSSPGLLVLPTRDAVQWLNKFPHGDVAEARMANRGNHYEAAFEAYLRDRQLPYVAIDESKRSLLGSESVKSLDFIVHSGERASWLIDVKGRRFPGAREQKQYWKNWSTRDDLRAMAAWERLFGAGFTGLFVFAYAITGDRSPLPPERLVTYRKGLYAFLGVRLRDYACYARPISAAWQTVALSSQRFREIARPVEEFLTGVEPAMSSFAPLAMPATMCQT